MHFVQIKCPLLTSERIEEAPGAAGPRHRERLCLDGLFARRIRIGVAKALGEVAADVGERQLLKDWSLYSSVASSSAGIELMHNVVILIGNSRFSTSPFTIGHAVMRDALDLAAVMQALESVGLSAPDAQAQSRLVNIFAKAEASPDGAIRGLRHTMLDDLDINATRHARAAVGGLIGGVAGTGAVYVSGGAEHQGPAGGGPVAVIARV